VVRGDFVMMDILPVLMAKAGNVLEVYASTLGMSVANAQALRSLADAGVWVHVVVSHYFAGVDRSTTFRQVRDILGPERVTVARSHCKVILVDGDAASFVVEGSANLRSSDCVEQFTVFNDDELLRWHRSWMEEIAHA
jgi:hypothetical protein